MNHVPPRHRVPKVDAFSSTDMRLPIDLQLKILAFEILTEKMEVILDLELALEWKDSRLMLNNLKNDSARNLLVLDIIQKIWTPQVLL